MKVSVTYEASKTINLGNYESAKIMVGVRLEDEGASEKDLYERAKKFVSEKLEAEEMEYRI